MISCSFSELNYVLRFGISAYQKQIRVGSKCRHSSEVKSESEVYYKKGWYTVVSPKTGRGIRKGVQDFWVVLVCIATTPNLFGLKLCLSLCVLKDASQSVCFV